MKRARLQVPTNRFTHSKADFRLNDHQRLRKMLLGQQRTELPLRQRRDARPQARPTRKPLRHFRLCAGFRMPAMIDGARYTVAGGRKPPRCQSALDWNPLSASKRDPFERRVLAVALAPSELAGVAKTARARAGT